MGMIEGGGRDGGSGGSGGGADGKLHGASTPGAAAHLGLRAAARGRTRRPGPERR